ncbi:MAG TPA: hypothetical protein VF152_07075 [Acidimicrobiia bacterium]
MPTGSRKLLAGAAVVATVLAACGDDGPGTATTTGGGDAPADIGVDRADLSPVIDHPFVAFASTGGAVFEGEEVDPDTGGAVTLRVESQVRERPGTVAGVDVTVVDVSDFEDGELVEQTEDYYAQDTAGTVYYLGERVDDYEDGEIVGHHGGWLAGEDGNRAGEFMPAVLEVGTEFAQEQVPGVAEDRSTVVAVGVSVTVPAGTFADCIETEDYDPIDDVTEAKFYCRGVGLVREVFPAGGSLDLVELRP